MAINSLKERHPLSPLEYSTLNGRTFKIPEEHRTHGVQPRLGYRSIVSQHPDFGPAVRRLTDNWNDKDQLWRTVEGTKKRFHEFEDTNKPANSADEVHLYSNGKRSAIVVFPENGDSKPPRIEALVDLDKISTGMDENMNFFESLVLSNLALYAGEQEKQTAETSLAQVESSEKGRTYSTVIESDRYPDGAIGLLSANWDDRTIIFTTVEGTKHPIGSFDLLDNQDKQLRLDFISSENILKKDGVEVAYIRAHRVPEHTQSQDDETQIPQPVISRNEVVVVGETLTLHNKHLALITESLEELTLLYEKNVADSQRRVKESEERLAYALQVKSLFIQAAHTHTATSPEEKEIFSVGD